MKTFILIIPILFGLSCGQSLSNTETVFDIAKVKKGELVVKVNGLEIKQGFIDLLSDLNPRIKTQLDNPLTRKKIIDSLIDQELLYQEAIKKGVHHQEDVLIKSLLNRHVIISNALVESHLDKSMRAAYDLKKEQQFTKIKVGLIAALFDPQGKPSAPQSKPSAEQKAAAKQKINKIKKRLDQGDDFAKVAKESSDDKKTKKKGGDAGEISKNDRRFARLGYKKLTEAAFNLKNGEYSQPIALKNGWYIVKALSEPTTIPYQEAQRPLRFELQNQTREELLKKLRQEAQIEIANVKLNTATPAKSVDIKKTQGKKSFIPQKGKHPHINYTIPKNKQHQHNH